MTAPLVATQFSQLHRWSFYYLASFGVAALNTVLLVCVFKFKTQDGTAFPLGTKSGLTHGRGFRMPSSNRTTYRRKRER